MGILSFLFDKKKPTSASVAKERLQIIIAREHSTQNDSPDFLPALKEELLAVIGKYIKVDKDAIKVSLDRKNNLEVLDVNIVINDGSSTKEEDDQTQSAQTSIELEPAPPQEEQKAA